LACADCNAKNAKFKLGLFVWPVLKMNCQIREDQMAFPENQNIKALAIGLAGAALTSALIDQLVLSRKVERDDMLRVMDDARRQLHRMSTQDGFREASAFLGRWRDNLPKVD
jgi:hypothetical protein